MNRLLFFSAGFSLIFAVSCSSSSNDNNTQTRIINIPTYKVEDRNAQDCRKLFSDAKRVSLKSTDKNTLEQDVTVIDGKDGKQALVVTELEPTVKGVVVVCEGGGDIKVVENLTNAVTTALNISSTRVSVIQSATIS